MMKILKLMITLPRLRRAIAKCFNGVCWDKQSFTINGGSRLTDGKGRDKFYAAEDIDEAIRKLNRILDLL